MESDKKTTHKTDIAEQVLIIENDVLAIEAMVYELIDTFKELFDYHELHSIAIGLTEILINAIEHGNLEVSYKEKTTLLDSGKYYNELKRRQFLPKYQKRRVTLSYKVSNNTLIICVKDDGEGFDWRNLPPVTERIADIHGRGICMTRYYFNEVWFNDKGNEVTLVKTIHND